MLVRSAFRHRSSISATLLATLLFAAPAIALHGQAPSNAIASIRLVAQQDRIPAHPDFAPLTQLSHQLPGWVQGRAQSSAHAVDLSTPIHVTLLLNRDPAVEAAFNQFLAAQQTPGSPLYHQWLTPQQLGTLYGPTANDLAALTTWLTSQGLKIDSIAPSGVMVHVSGSAAVLGNAFHTSFAMFDPNEGMAAAPRLSAVSEPSIPSVLTPLVRTIHGLGEMEIKPLNQARPMQAPAPPAGANPSAGVKPFFTNGSDHYIVPGDFAVIYDINTVYHVGNMGAKIGSKTQHVAVIGESRVVNTDITEFEGLVGLTASTPTVVIPTGDTDPGTTSNDIQGEATLDVDRVIGTAPGAAVDLVVSKYVQATNSGGIFSAMTYNVDTLLDPVMTISFGGCESQNGLSAVDFVDTLAKSGVAEGITTLVSSGDSGASGCEASFTPVTGTQVLSINFICSTTYVTCVGGTEFNDAAGSYWLSSNSNTFVSAVSYIPEGGWNEPSSLNSSNATVYAPAASGGGVSTFIAKPSWQTGTGVPTGSFRFVPDVSFPAAAHDGYFACLAYNGGDCATQHFEVFSGTSAAAPSMAGVVALINTSLGTASGNINPVLYTVAASTPSAYHDITVATSGVTGCTAATPSMCNNSTPAASTLTGGLAGYLLTTGYDEVTGLGSMDVGNLVAAVAATPSLISTTLTITPPATVSVGQSVTFTAVITPASGTGTPTGTVQFYSNGTALGAAINVTGTTVVTPAQTFSAAGTYVITAIYSGDSIFATSTAPGVNFVVTASTGSFTLVASPTTLAFAAGTTVGDGFGINALTSGGFTSNITLSSCTITFGGTGTAHDPPTCSFSTSTLVGNSGATVTVNTTAPTTSTCPAGASKTASTRSTPWLGGSAGIVLAGLLLLLPLRRRRVIRSLAIACIVTLGIASLSGCGGSSTSTGSPCTPTITPGTTTGVYTISITGTGGGVTAAPAVVTVTIN